jgi:glycosyltransferase involved in cell wall biosynthesis
MPDWAECTGVLSVVMPAHNEAAYLESAVREVDEGLRARGHDLEVLVVENGSTDDTLAVARRLADALADVRVLSRPVADYGAALREGMLAARGELLVTFDVDYYDLTFVDSALELLTGTAPTPAIVVGSKRAPGARDERPWLRRLVTTVFSTLLRLVFSLSVSDTHGMKAMRRAPVAPILEQCRFRTDLFDTELVIRTERAGLEVAELPVTAQERRPSRTPIWRRVPRTLVGMIVLRGALDREARRPRTAAS